MLEEIVIFAVALFLAGVLLCLIQPVAIRKASFLGRRCLECPL
jgi:hypothetical protein